MNRDYLKQIMIDQKETYLNNPMIKRDYPLEDNVNYCFVGIRRTGKSYMMYQQIKHLQENGIRYEKGVVLTKYHHVMGQLPRMLCVEAGHPVPDENSF